MTDNQVFAFLAKFASPRDVKVVMQNKRIGFLNIPWVAWQFWRGIPVAKIIHKKWFYGLSFYTNKYTLDPRPDSETLVDAVLKNESGAKRILDLGTGTGCLLCAILKNLPNASGIGIDKSRRARHVARLNVRALGLKNKIEIKKGTFRNPGFVKDFDVIIANPPYIPIGDSRVDRGAGHDPKMALYGGRDGMKYYKEIADNIPPAKGIKSYVEIGAGQERTVRKIFQNAGWKFVEKHKDLSGRVRIIEFLG